MNFNMDIKNFISNWNQRCPIDRWWREKHKISFNSPTHRAASFIDMYIEYAEFIIYIYKPSLEKKKEEDKGEDIYSEYIPGEGNFLKMQKLSKEDIDELFDKLDIDEL